MSRNGVSDEVGVSLQQHISCYFFNNSGVARQQQTTENNGETEITSFMLASYKQRRQLWRKPSARHNMRLIKRAAATPALACVINKICGA
jgi:hypothetical protein